MELGFNMLVGSDEEKILQAYRALDSINFELVGLTEILEKGTLYGNGAASARIVEELLR